MQKPDLHWKKKDNGILYTEPVYYKQYNNKINLKAFIITADYSEREELNNTWFKQEQTYRFLIL